MLHNDQHLTMKSSIMVEQSEQMVCGFQRPDFERLRAPVGLLVAAGSGVHHLRPPWTRRRAPRGSMLIGPPSLR